MLDSPVASLVRAIIGDGIAGGSNFALAGKRAQRERSAAAEADRIAGRQAARLLADEPIQRAVARARRCAEPLQVGPAPSPAGAGLRGQSTARTSWHLIDVIEEGTAPREPAACSPRRPAARAECRRIGRPGKVLAARRLLRARMAPSD